MAKLKFCVVLLISTELVCHVAGTAKTKGQRHYNEQCVPYDSSASCDSSQGLMCVDSGLKGYRCSCPTNKLHAQVFDNKRNACVGLVLNACVRGSTKSTLNETLCVEHAECDTSVYGMAICLCKSGFTETDDGACTPSLKYGDVCGEIDETSSETPKSVRGQCDEKHGQKCIDGKCQCRFPSEQYYDPKEGCVSFANGRCFHEGQFYQCVAGAKCPAPPLRIGGGVPVGLPPLPPFLSAFASAAAEAGDGDGLLVMNLRPRLPPPPPPPPHRHMLHHPPPYHHPPLPKDALTEFDSSFDHYDFARSVFFGPNSQRKGEDGEYSNEPRCECMPGFTQTSDGYCMKGYGTKCDPDSDTISGNNTNFCNGDKHLECMDDSMGGFSCQCRNQMNERYDSELQECVAKINRRCRKLGNYPKCEKGSECVDGICQCTNGTSLTPMETCAKDFEEKCEPGHCNAWKGLMCHGKSKTCLCLDSYLRYDPIKKACVASKGSHCGSVRSTKGGSSWGETPEIAYVECEEGSQCKPKEVGGKKMGEMCE